MGNIQQQFYNLYNYNTDFEALCYPSDSASTTPYPFYDRWGDIWNVQTEMVNVFAARSLGTIGFLAAQTSYRTQTWQAQPASISVPRSPVPVGQPATVTLQAPAGMDLSSARITWEGLGQVPIYGGTSFVFTPVASGAQWVEAEAQLPDGRRVFAQGSFTAN